MCFKCIELLFDIARAMGRKRASKEVLLQFLEKERVGFQQMRDDLTAEYELGLTE